MGYQTPDDLTAADEYGAEEYGKLRDAILASIFTRLWLGGSRRFSVQGTGAQDAFDAVPFVIPDAASAGATYKALVYAKTADAGTTITPRIRNITDSTTAVTGSAVSATSFGAPQTLTFTPVVGKEYRLQFTKSNDDAPAWGFGVLQRTDA